MSPMHCTKLMEINIVYVVWSALPTWDDNIIILRGSGGPWDVLWRLYSTLIIVIFGYTYS